MTRARDLGDFIADGAAPELVVDTTTLVVDSSNNRVGIGTASPSQALDVSGTGNFTAVTAGTITIDDITIDGSTISDAADLTMDVGGDLIIDVDGGDVFLKDAGTSFGFMSKSSDDLRIGSLVSDGDVLVRGNDGGSMITALTLDMSEAGAATFNGDVIIPDKILHDGDTNTAIRFPAADTVTVETGGSERTRVDSSGHFYIGKTSSSSAVVGTFIQGTGGIDATRDGNRVFVANRLSSDGEIINLQKDNSTVGSIAADNLNITISAYGEEYQALSGTSVTIDCRAGNNFALTTSGNTTFTFSNATSSGTAFGFTLKLTSGGSHTITYPNSVDFAGGTAPDAPASGETDILVFYTVDGGTNWYGALAIDAAG